MTVYANLGKWYLFSGHVLGILICGCSLLYRRELRASKSADFNT